MNNDTATTEIYTLSLHDALPISSTFNELSARGAAILAARSVGALAHYPRLEQTRYQPDPQAHARYAALYPVYRLLREQMLPVWQARQDALHRLSQEQHS